MKTNGNCGINMNLPFHIESKGVNFSNILLGPLPTSMGKGAPTHSFLSEQFENHWVYTSQENGGVWCMITTVTCSLAKPPGQSRARCLCYSQHLLFCCPNSATTATTKHACSLAPALRFNLLLPWNHQQRLGHSQVWSGNRP